MLKVGSKVLDLSNPTTDIEKKVVERIEEIREQYKLDAGNKLMFVYPARYIMPDKANPGKFDKPASIKIQFRDIVRDKKAGAVEWRWFESTTGSDEKGNLRYNPNTYFFSGTWTLGEEHMDLIYFLLDIYSHTEGGKNWSEGVSVYIAVDDKIKEAADYEKNQKATLLVQNAIFGEATGLTEENLRLLAGAAGVVQYRELDLGILKKQLHIILSKDLANATSLINNMRKGSKNVEYVALVQELKDANIVIMKGVGKTREWFFTEGEGVGMKIMKVVGGSTPESQLADYIEADESLAEDLKARLHPEE